MPKFVDGRATVVVHRDGKRWGALLSMRLNEALRAQPGDLVELSTFSKRFAGRCRIPHDWTRSSTALGGSDPLFYVTTQGEGPLLIDGYQVAPDSPG